jgi:BT4734-like, N-terminal domain/Primase C terminal 2 (PriCT-2)
MMAYSPLTAPVSLFQGSTDTMVKETIPLADVLKRIQDGTYRPYVEHLRQVLATKGEAAYKRAKAQSIAFTPCCALSTRAQKVPMAQKLRSVVGIVHYDFDHVADPAALKARLAENPATVFAFTSPSGVGVKVGLAASGITDAVSYKAVWHAVLRQLKQTYADVTISEDEKIKYVNALCFVSDDPDLYVNPKAIPVVVPALGPDDEEPPLEIPDSPDGERIPFTTLAQAVWFIPCEDYDDWSKVGMAWQASGYRQARAMWDAWSMQSSKYTAADQHTTWGSFRADGGIHPGEILRRAHKHGWRPAWWGKTSPVDQNGHRTDAEGITEQLLSRDRSEKHPHEIRPRGITELTERVAPARGASPPGAAGRPRWSCHAARYAASGVRRGSGRR